jgi:hypothetical protein
MANTTITSRMDDPVQAWIMDSAVSFAARNGAFDEGTSQFVEPSLTHRASTANPHGLTLAAPKSMLVVNISIIALQVGSKAWVFVRGNIDQGGAGAVLADTRQHSARPHLQAARAI